MFSAIANLINHRAARVVVAAALFAALAGTFGGPGVAKLHGGGFEDPDSPGVAARTRLEQATGIHPDGGLIALIKTGQDVESAATRGEVEKVAGILKQEGAIARVLTFYETQDATLVAANRKSTYVIGLFKAGNEEALQAAATRIEKRLSGDPQVRLGGAVIANQQVSGIISQDLARAELLAFPILFLLSLWVFRGLIAAFLPPLVGGITIVGALLGLRLINTVTPLSIFALDLVIGMGLGLAIDYSLFITSRFREEMARGLEVSAALHRTLQTAGRTVLFSSLTVAAALLSLVVFPLRFLVSMGIGGVLVPLMAASVALLVLPAVLRLLGPRVNALALRRGGAGRAERPVVGGFWYRLSALVMRRPGPIAIVSAVVLIALGLPFTGIKFTTVDVSVLPTTESARQVRDALTAEFPAAAGIASYVVVPAGPDQGAAVAAFADAIGRLPGAALVSKPQFVSKDTWKIDVVPRAGDLADSSQTLVRQIRALPAPFSPLVGGPTVAYMDLQASLAQHLPLAILIVVVATVFLLFLLTGSIILPVKAVVMNLLTLSAAYGILVLIFQDGRLQGLLRYTSQGALESTQPILLFAIVFGLSTDYGVFLLTRIKEGRDAGELNAEAVARGLERTGRIVTAAALLFCVAIGAFATSRIVFIKELGIGTAAGVLIDASIVRALLVPALMALLGKWNWWAPGPLRRLHARIGLSENAPAA
jgi:RND superfamily putative drug exporter